MDTNLLRLSAAYGALANGGHYVAPRLFISALGPEGAKLASAAIVEQRVADEAASFVLTNILQGVIERGTARKVRQLGYSAPLAGKTGTSNDSRDAWFVGYTPDLVSGVWVGFDDNHKTGLTGGSGAVPIWTEYMTCAREFYQPQAFVMPPGVVSALIDIGSNELAGRECPQDQRVSEVFVEGTQPQKLCRQHHPDYSEAQNSEPARDYDPPATAPSPKRRQRSFWDNLFGD
jgi:penicillin-binding protein 1B